MGLFKKNLDEMVAKILEKEGKIKSKIAELEQSIENNRAAIQAEYATIVDQELSGEMTESAAAPQARIKKIQSNITELEYLLEGYRNKLSERLVTDEELEKIRERALEEQSEWSEKKSNILAKRDSLEQKIKALEEEKENLTREANRIIDPTVPTVAKIIKHIDPLTSQIRDKHTREHFANTWIYEGDLEQIMYAEGLKETPIGPLKSHEASYDSIDPAEREEVRRRELMEYSIQEKQNRI